MKLITTENRWDCTAAAFAMALGVSLESLIQFIGHDGSAVIDSAIPEPNGRRGFHVQEMIELVLMQGKSATPFQIQPASRVGSEVVMVNQKIDRRVGRFQTLIETKRGVMFGRLRNNNMHAVAFDQGSIYDPRGQQYEFENLKSCANENGILAVEIWIIE